jgi:uncharacterized repeat protein (TIGR03833 family)
MDYKTDGGYYYRITPKKTGGRKSKKKFKSKKKGNGYKHILNKSQSATVSRISCKEYDDPTMNKNIGRIMPKIGDMVIIIIKPYQQFNCKKGLVNDIYTKKLIHTRGHKVKLKSGEVGRVLKIL